MTTEPKFTEQQVRVTDELRNACAAEWDHLLNKTFSTPMAVEHLAQFVLSHRQAAEREAEADAFARTVARVIRFACDTTEAHRRKDAVIVPTREWHRIMALVQDADALRERLTRTGAA